MVLEAAPLRALITRPRGGEGGQASAGLPYYASPAAARPPAGPPSKFVPENRRRLQGTLLTCSLYKRAPLANLVEPGRGSPGPGAVHRHRRRRPQGGGQERGQPEGRRARRSARRWTRPRPIACCARCRCTRSYGFDFGLLPALAHGTTLFLEDEISPKRIAKLLREQKIDFFAGTPALYGALVRVPTVKPLKTAGARFLSSGSIAAGGHRRELPPALRRAPRLLLPQHRRPGRSRSTGPARIPSTVGRPFDGVELRVAGPKGERLPGRRAGAHLGASPAIAVRCSRSRRSTSRSATTASRSAASRPTAGCAPATSARRTRAGGSPSPAARTTWSRSTASGSRSARSRGASRRSRRSRRRRRWSSPTTSAARW